MNFQITYTTRYAYSKPVRDNLNVLRIKPASTPHQVVEDFSFRVDPETRLHQYRDYFGAEVIEFGVTEPHDHLALEARMRVATREQEVDPVGGWDLTRTDDYRAAAGEFLLIGEGAPQNGTVAGLTEEVRGENVLETVLSIAETIPQRFTYESGATFVGSTVQDLIEGGAGVCQDFVHLGALVLRRLGVGARYVSGYLFAAPADGGEDSVEVQTHAWLEALIPEVTGERRWIGVDPTNTGRAGETHVKIGHGRDYQDVAPIRGVYQGGATAELTAGVSMRRVSGG
jgi:transglutaminase-like putative cysteine protease